jgi:uncharacterized protein
MQKPGVAKVRASVLNPQSSSVPSFRQLTLNYTYRFTSMYDSDKRKFLSLLCHGSIFAGSLLIFIGLPIAILLVSDDPAVKDNAKESLNFHLNVWLYEAILGILWISIVGIPFAALLAIPFFLFHWILPVLAILKIIKDPDMTYRYPFIFRLL